MAEWQEHDPSKRPMRRIKWSITPSYIIEKKMRALKEQMDALHIEGELSLVSGLFGPHLRLIPRGKLAQMVPKGDVFDGERAIQAIINAYPEEFGKASAWSKEHHVEGWE